MDEGRLSLMKEDAILISSGRGSVLDQEALARTMKGGRLWGAALDVTEPEPLPTDSPLWDIPNLIITPHVAGGMRLELTRRVCIQMAQDNLRRYLAGEPLKNRVRWNIERGPTPRSWAPFLYYTSLQTRPGQVPVLDIPPTGELILQLRPG